MVAFPFLGKVEKKIYKMREEHPLVIPQVDPENKTPDELISLFNDIRALNLDHIAIGGSILDPVLLQDAINLAVRDYDFSVVTYLSNSSVAMIKGIKGKTAVYWMLVVNAENPFYFRDNLIMSSISISRKNLETIPTAYVFDDRGSVRTADWLTRAIAVPREKPDISLSIALASQFSGMRFYIMAGGSGASSAPPISHIKLISEKTNLFLIPTSGIRTVVDARNIFGAGADAIHIGRLLEDKGGIKLLTKIVKESKRYAGKEFL
jgi:phosphoglycerol geranylgeranyltransferase